MNRKEIEEFCQQNDIELLLADGFEEALIGFIPSLWQNQKCTEIAVYDRQKCIEILMERDQMPEEEAEEYFQFNVEGAYFGEQTPIFIYPVRQMSLQTKWRPEN